MTTPSKADTLHWYAAQLKPNGLKAAQLNLKRQGFQTFMPQIPISKRIQNKIVHRSEPLFPGYLFVGASESGAPLNKVGHTLGVGRLVAGLDGQPAALPLELISLLHSRTDADGKLGPAETLARGTKVQITAGPLMDWFAEVERCRDGERVDLLLSFMGRVVRTNLSRREVKKT